LRAMGTNRNSSSLRYIGPNRLASTPLVVFMNQNRVQSLYRQGGSFVLPPFVIFRDSD
jgi:hypothetical protein